MIMELSKTFVVRLPFQGAHPDSLSQNVRVPWVGTLPRASSGIFLTPRPLPLASGWQLQTPTVDFHHLDICHAWHTSKKGCARTHPFSMTIFVCLNVITE